MGISSKEKKQLALNERRERLRNRQELLRNHLDYGSIKPSRRIPDVISRAVQIRDTGKFFGRPGHVCVQPGPPHHIIHFEKFERGEVQGNPHTMENLEAPCAECHKLAHELKIPSGVDIKTFFESKFGSPTR